MLEPSCRWLLASTRLLEPSCRWLFVKAALLKEIKRDPALPVGFEALVPRRPGLALGARSVLRHALAVIPLLRGIEVPVCASRLLCTEKAMHVEASRVCTRAFELEVPRERRVNLFLPSTHLSFTCLLFNSFRFLPPEYVQACGRWVFRV